MLFGRNHSERCSGGLLLLLSRSFGLRLFFGWSGRSSFNLLFVLRSAAAAIAALHFVTAARATAVALLLFATAALGFATTSWLAAGVTTTAAAVATMATREQAFEGTTVAAIAAVATREQAAVAAMAAVAAEAWHAEAAVASVRSTVATVAAAEEGESVARNGQHGHDQGNPRKIHFHSLHSRTRVRLQRRRHVAKRKHWPEHPTVGQCLGVARKRGENLQRHVRLARMVGLCGVVGPKLPECRVTRNTARPPANH